MNNFKRLTWRNSTSAKILFGVLLIVLTGLCALPVFSDDGEEIPELTWWDLLSLPELLFYENYDPFADMSETEFPPVQVNHTLDGKRVRLPGYMVNLDGDFRMTRNFLLVPSAGACIHVPPPPENQIVLVESKRRVSFDLYVPVWVEGVLSVSEFSNDYASGMYTLVAEKTEEYTYE